MDVQRAEGLRPGVAVRTQILSVDNGSTVQNITSFRSIQAKAPGGNVTVQIESQDVTKAKGSSAAKIIPPPPKPPNKEDFEVQIKSVERVDGKKPIRPMRNATPSVAKKKSASALDIKVWTVTDAPKARNQVPAARREYNSKLWADDRGPKLSCQDESHWSPFDLCTFLLFQMSQSFTSEWCKWLERERWWMEDNSSHSACEKEGQGWVVDLAIVRMGLHSDLQGAACLWAVLSWLTWQWASVS